MSASRLSCTDTFGKPDPYAEVSYTIANFTLSKLTRT